MPFHQPFDAAFGVGDDEQPHGVGVVLEDMEAGASHDDAGFLRGEVFQDFFLLKIQLLRVDLEVFVGDGGGAAELLVEPAEVGPPVPLRGFDLLNILFGELVFFHDGGEDFLAIDFEAELLAQFFSEFLAAGSRLAVDGDDEFGVFHIVLFNFLFFELAKVHFFRQQR